MAVLYSMLPVFLLMFCVLSIAVVHFVLMCPSLQAVPVKLSLDALLQMTGSQVREIMRRLGSSSEECARLSAALSCLKSATESGEFLLQESLLDLIPLSTGSEGFCCCVF